MDITISTFFHIKMNKATMFYFANFLKVNIPLCMTNISCEQIKAHNNYKNKISMQSP